MSNKKNSCLLIPGPEGWEIWASEAGNVFSQSLDDGPLLVSEIEDIPSANLVMGFPVREALAVPFKVPTNDEAMFDDLASMHLEKSGIRVEENAGRLTDCFFVDQNDGQSTLLAVVLSAPEPSTLPSPSPSAFDISARFFPMAKDAITLWRELGRWVFAVSSHGKLTYFQSLSGERLSGETIRDVYLALTQLGLQGVNLELRKAVVWTSGSSSDPSDDEVQAFGRQLGAEVMVEARPNPLMPESISKLIPADARSEKRVKDKRQKRKVLIAAVLVLYIGLATYFGYQYMQLTNSLKKQDAMIGEVRIKHADIALFNADWQQLAAAVDSQRWPLQLLYRTATMIPPKQGLRFKVFEASRERILIQGEASDLKATSSYAEKIRRSLKDYEWSLPPAEDDRKTNRWKFNYEGKLKGDL
jgi:hypothetical protein